MCCLHIQGQKINQTQNSYQALKFCLTLVSCLVYSLSLKMRVKFLQGVALLPVGYMALYMRRLSSSSYFWLNRLYFHRQVKSDWTDPTPRLRHRSAPSKRPDRGSSILLPDENRARCWNLMLLKHEQIKENVQEVYQFNQHMKIWHNSESKVQKSYHKLLSAPAERNIYY